MMNPMLYFLPGVSAADDAALARAGLEHLAARPGKRAGAIGSGPGGVGGCLVAFGSFEPARLACVPAEQEWPEGYQAEATHRPKTEGPESLQASAFGLQPLAFNFRLGWWKGAKPGPEDLERPDLIDGHPVKLEDGNLWTIPLARVFGLGGPRQRKLRLGPDGKWVIGEAINRLAALASDAESLYQELAEQFRLAAAAIQAGGVPILPALLPKQAVVERALALNYWVSPAEIDALELLSIGNIQEIGKALIDWPTFEAELKKNGASLQNSGGGD